MQPFDVQFVAIEAPPGVVLRYVADRYTLPEWTHAFKSVDAEAAVLATPEGATRIALSVSSEAAFGAVDWIMTFPDDSKGRAHARIVENVDGTSILVFVLLAPPVPQERIEGTLEQQRAILRSELRRLKEILEAQALGDGGA